MTIGLDEFAKEVRAFLDANTVFKSGNQREWGRGSDNVSIFADTPVEEMRAARDWQRTRFDNGLGWITGPAEYGGRDLSSYHQLTFDEIESEYDVPDTTDLRIVGLALVGPTILEHGTDEQRKKFLRALYRGDTIACQLFSEPSAGSDLANLRTFAERTEGGWLVNGQKVWTSVAHHSDIGELLCRTNRDVPKHRGITAFVVDMDSPGIEVRPLRQMTGGAEFNEVFFTDVFIPDDRRLGPIDGGWNVALTTLMNERSAVGADDTIAAGDALNLDWLSQLMDTLDLRSDPVARRGLAELHVARATTGYVNSQLRRTVRAGNVPGPEASVAKLMNTRNVGDAAQFVSELLGARMVADNGEWGTFAWNDLLLSTPALRLLGGTDEIMKNILGERVLGLPKEPILSQGSGGKS